MIRLPFGRSGVRAFARSGVRTVGEQLELAAERLTAAAVTLVPAAWGHRGLVICRIVP